MPELETAETIIELPIPPEVDLEALCPGRKQIPWLEAYLQELATSPAATDRIAAIGGLLRFSRPASSTQRFSFGYQLADIATAWLAQCTGLDRMERVACRQAGQLCDALEEMLTTEAPLSSYTDAAISILCERDTLESVWVALKKASAGESLKESLHVLDLQGKSMVPMLGDLLKDVENPRLEAVQWQEPDAWWGQFIPLP